MTDTIIPPKAPASDGSPPSITYTEMLQSQAIQYVELVQPVLGAGVLRSVIDTLAVDDKIGVRFIDHDPREPILYFGTITQMAVDGFALKLEDGTTMHIRIQSIAYWKSVPA